MRFGWPLSLDSGFRKVARSCYRYEPVGSKRDVESTGNVALGKDEPVPLGIIDVLGSDVENGPIERGEDVDGGKVATDVAGSGVVDQLQILNADLPRGLGNLRDLLVAMRMWQPVKDRHGDVIGS